MVFTRDLRIHDNPSLAAAVADADRVLPIYVFDEGGQGGPRNANQRAFLAESLRDLDGSLRSLGAALTVRAGPWHEEVLRAARAIGASRVHVAEDVDPEARRRLDRLRAEAMAERVDVPRHPGSTVAPPGLPRPAGGAEYKVFGAYHRAWLATQWRPIAERPRAITLPVDARPEPGALVRLLAKIDDRRGPVAASRPGAALAGGETAGSARWREWSARRLGDYAADRDLLAGEATSRISPYLRLGCLSARRIAGTLIDLPGGEAFVRQLCWRDFFYQILAARPDAAFANYREPGPGWRSQKEPEDAVRAWRAGRTGYPVVDAGMRQLALEGFLPNRARMIVASFLTKDLACDWRIGAEHFMSLLTDADIAINQLNWQWVAGTGTDANPHRVFNPTRQGLRFDPLGRYVRRYVPELADLPGGSVHDPDPATRRQRGYPEPIVDHAMAMIAYRTRRAAAVGRRPTDVDPDMGLSKEK